MTWPPPWRGCAVLMAASRARSSPSVSASAARNSFLQATRKHGLAGVIGFYGSPGPGRSSPTPTELAGEFECPVLGLFGGADEGIPQSLIDGFAIALDQAASRHEIDRLSAGAPHSFFDRHQAQYAEQSADAWQRIQAFIKDHTPS